MKTTPLIPSLAALAVTAAAAAPALAHPPGPPAGPPAGPAAHGVLDQDLPLTSAMTTTAPGRTRTRTVRGPEGETHTVVTVRAARAAGPVESDVLTATGEDPGDLAGTLKFTARSSDEGDGSVNAVLTVTSADGRLRLRLAGPANDDGSFEAAVVAARGTGAFEGVRIDGDADLEAVDGGVAVDLDGEYEYGDEPAGPPAPGGPMGPAGPPAPPTP